MSNPSVSRRKFLQAAGLTVAASAFACSGLGYAAMRSPAIATPAASFGKETDMNQNVLIVYATRAGSTVDVANAIGQTLAKRGFSVDVKPAKTHPSPKGYQAVLVGSAVRMGMWLPEAVGFLKTNAETLKQVPLALFSVHTSNLGDDPKSAAARRSYLEDVLPLVPNGVETAFFAGVIDPTRLSFLARMITRAVKSPVGDFRDWTKIDAWAQTVLA